MRVLLVLHDGTFSELTEADIVVAVKEHTLGVIDSEYGGQFPFVPDCENLDLKLPGVLWHEHVLDLTMKNSPGGHREFGS
jgi:hypothetical protein